MSEYEYIMLCVLSSLFHYVLTSLFNWYSFADTPNDLDIISSVSSKNKYDVNNRQAGWCGRVALLIAMGITRGIRCV